MKYLISILFSIFIYNSHAQSQSPCPCCKEEFRQFDFWLGEWSVTNNGNMAGENVISISQDSCVLIENWTSSRGKYTGTSYNFYDSKTKMWYQTWVDNQGGNLRLKGTFQDGKMILMDEASFNKDGKLVTNKITWTPLKDGTVRQHWQVSTDLGSSWNTAFDGIYKRK